MKILNERDKFLSNYEVLDHLKGIKQKYNWTFTPEDDEALKKAKGKYKKRFTACGLDLEVVTKEVLSYLDKSPCSAIDSPDSFEKLMTHLNTLDLMKIEKLQIMNTLPRSMVNLYSLVEECDQRFDEDTSQLIIDKINELFPVEEEEEEEEEEVGEEGEEGENEEAEQADPEDDAIEVDES